MSNPNSTNIDDVISDLIEIREHNKAGKYFPGEMTKPGISIERAAKMICKQRDFVNREMLTNNIMVFYLTNTDIFNCIVCENLRKHVQWDDKYLDECASDLASLIFDGKVYGVPTGIFTAWDVKKETKSSFKLTLDEAFKEISGYSISGI
jgi:hypothetical protein